MKAILSATLILLAVCMTRAAELRTWTNSSGQTLSAKFIEAVLDDQGKPQAAKIKLANGQNYTLEMTNLSSTDQDYVAGALKEQLAVEQKAKLAKRKAKWTDNWEEAQAESKETGLPILLFITGSDWCGYCMQLKSQVFESREFQKYANENAVLMVADFPKATQQSSSLKEQNKKLASEFPASGYPTVLLIKDGKQIARKSGYSGDSPKDYLAKLFTPAQ
jgi:thioredoxin-related protein